MSIEVNNVILVGYDVSDYKNEIEQFAEEYNTVDRKTSFYFSKEGKVYFGAPILEWETEGIPDTYIGRENIKQYEELADLGLIDLRHFWKLSDKTYWNLVDKQALYVFEEWR